MTIFKMWVCEVVGCNRQAFKRIWMHDMMSPATELEYKLMIDICKKHYNEEKRVGSNMTDVLVYRSSCT